MRTVQLALLVTNRWNDVAAALIDSDLERNDTGPGDVGAQGGGPDKEKVNGASNVWEPTRA